MRLYVHIAIAGYAKHPLNHLFRMDCVVPSQTRWALEVSLSIISSPTSARNPQTAWWIWSVQTFQDTAEDEIQRPLKLRRKRGSRIFWSQQLSELGIAVPRESIGLNFDTCFLVLMKCCYPALFQICFRFCGISNTIEISLEQHFLYKIRKFGAY
jgi:hypothetical protein